MTTLGEYVSRLRIERGWSLRDLAKKAGVSFGAIQDIEDGSTSSPGLKVIVGVAHALRVPVVNLINAYEGKDPDAQTVVSEHFTREILEFIRDNAPRETVRQVFPEEEKKG